jgi:hypothetical protein
LDENKEEEKKKLGEKMKVLFKILKPFKVSLLGGKG